MVCIFGTSWNNKRPCGVAFTFQVKQHFVETQGNVTINVFANDPRGSFACNNFKQERPDVSVVFFSFSKSGDTEWLAWVSTVRISWLGTSLSGSFANSFTSLAIGTLLKFFASILLHHFQCRKT